MNKTIGIQIGPDSFVDEGTNKVLDILQERAAINTIYLSTFTYDRGITGRISGKTFPDHGVQRKGLPLVWCPFLSGILENSSQSLPYVEPQGT